MHACTARRDTGSVNDMMSAGLSKHHHRIPADGSSKTSWISICRRPEEGGRWPFLCMHQRRARDDRNADDLLTSARHNLPRRRKKVAVADLDERGTGEDTARIRDEGSTIGLLYACMHHDAADGVRAGEGDAAVESTRPVPTDFMQLLRRPLRVHLFLLLVPLPLLLVLLHDVVVVVVVVCKYRSVNMCVCVISKWSL